MNRRQSLSLALAAAAFLMGCSSSPSTPTQPGSDLGPPFRTTNDADASGLMLQGHDPVAYFSQGAAVAGNPALQSVYQGVTWRFASAANQAAFLQQPEKYMPQFGGFCANGINYAVPWGGGGGPNSWRIYRGKLYVFGGQAARDHFEMDTEKNLQLAHGYWRSEIAGSNPLLVRTQRLVVRVPHYKTDAALQAEWQAKQAAGTLPVMPGQPQVVPAGN